MNNPILETLEGNNKKNIEFEIIQNRFADKEWLVDHPIMRGNLYNFESLRIRLLKYIKEFKEFYLEKSIDWKQDLYFFIKSYIFEEIKSAKLDNKKSEIYWTDWLKNNILLWKIFNKKPSIIKTTSFNNDR